MNRDETDLPQHQDSGLQSAQWDIGDFGLTFPGQPGGDPGGAGYGRLYTYDGPGSTKMEHFIIHDQVLGAFTAPNFEATYVAAPPTDFDPRGLPLGQSGKRYLASQVHNREVFAPMAAPPAGGLAYVAEVPAGAGNTARAYLYRVSTGPNAYFDTWAFGPAFDFSGPGVPLKLHPEPGLNAPNTWKNHVNANCSGGKMSFCSWSFAELK